MPFAAPDRRRDEREEHDVAGHVAHGEDQFERSIVAMRRRRKRPPQDDGEGSRDEEGVEQAARAVRAAWPGLVQPQRAHDGRREQQQVADVGERRVGERVAPEDVVGPGDRTRRPERATDSHAPPRGVTGAGGGTPAQHARDARCRGLEQRRQLLDGLGFGEGEVGEPERDETRGRGQDRVAPPFALHQLFNRHLPMARQWAERTSS